MQSTRTFTASPVTLHRLGSLSMLSFAVVTLSFYASLVQAGYDPGLALLACTSAGIAFLLMRVEKRVAAPAMAMAQEAIVLPKISEQFLAEGQLLVTLDGLIRQSRSAKGEIGLMFVSVCSSSADGDAPESGVMDLLRGRLFRDADSKVFQLDEHTLAIAERRPDVATHLEMVSAGLHEELRVRERVTQSLAPVQLTVGVALTDNPKASVAELFTGARSATRLTDAQGGGTFFRQI